MTDSITFATEADRLKAREQFAAMMQAVYPSPVSKEFAKEFDGSRFDRAFPPIKPPKMAPCTAWALVDGAGECYAIRFTAPDTLPEPHRIARVRVEEIEETP